MFAVRGLGLLSGGLSKYPILPYPLIVRKQPRCINLIRGQTDLAIFILLATIDSMSEEYQIIGGSGSVIDIYIS